MVLLGHLAACGGGHEPGPRPALRRPAAASTRPTDPEEVPRPGVTELAERALVKPSPIGPDDSFGIRVALEADTLVVAATHEDSGARGVGGNPDDDSARDSGAVYVFRRTATGWQQVAYLKASNTGMKDGFGLALALSGDTLVVGAPGEDSAATGLDGDQDDDGAVDSGAVYVFRRVAAGWRQEAYLKASNAGAGDELGTSVAVHGDTLVVGALREDSAAAGGDGAQHDEHAVDSGAVYVFRRSAAGWRQEAYLKASSPDADDFFGGSVALSGNTLVVGAPGEDRAGDGPPGGARDSGAVYVFQRSAAGWRQEACFEARETDYEDMFGRSVALWQEHTLVVGAPFSDGAAVDPVGKDLHERPPGIGAAYVFRRMDSGWQQEAELRATGTVVGFFSGTVSVHGDLVAVGAELDVPMAAGDIPDGTWGGGAVYVFRRTGATWQQFQRIQSEHTGPDDLFGGHLALFDGVLAVGALGEDSAALGIEGDPDEGAPESGAVYLFH
jgi:trimeric autotransporter adhesin